MIEPVKRKTIFLLHEGGMSLREIARRMKVGRNTIRGIIRGRGVVPTVIIRDRIKIETDLLQRLYGECQGRKQRVYEKLVEEHGIQVGYATVTRMLRDLGLGQNQQKARCGRVPDVPGAEMQHDTSPYTLKIGGRPTDVQGSLLYLRYSKSRYLKFYRRFNRFCMKCFLYEALMHWGYAAPLCIIDNTNLARLRGTGRDAVMVPEMEDFARQLGFRFECHEVGHSNRKAGNERSFWTVETNFFPGRSFRDMADLNRQAFEWCTVRMQNRPASRTGLIPAKAFEQERAHLILLPSGLSAPYQVHERITDEYGYAAFNGNFYWVPGTGREDLRLLEYADRLQIYCGRKLLAEYGLPVDDKVKNQRFVLEGHPMPNHGPKRSRKLSKDDEKKLRSMGEVVSTYLDFAIKHKGKGGRIRFVRDLFRLAQQTSAVLFIRIIERALKYRIADIGTIHRIAHMQVSEGFGTLPSIHVDEGLEEREAYMEGRLTDEPDLSAYDKLLEEDNG